MKNLLYKEFKLLIVPGFFLLSLLGALILIPNWPYYIALMYAMFITIPNIFTASKTQNDLGFSVMLPVKKSDVVKARVLSIIVIELLQIVVAAIFAAVNIILYKGNNIFQEPNVAHFGLAFVMFAIYNIILFPGFYKTGYKLAVPAVVATIVAFFFMAGIECLNLLVPAAGAYLDSITNMANQIPLLLGGILIFVIVNVLAFKVSAKRFAKIDL